MTLTAQQNEILDQLDRFLADPHQQLFLLKGYAGTGKTTLLGMLAQKLTQRERPFRLLATTGRAAKVLQNKTGYNAGTVHGCIYAFDDIVGRAEDRQDTSSPAGAAGDQLQLHFQLRDNAGAETEEVYIIDEASMISHEVGRTEHTAQFGSGSILHDLLAFADGRKVIFVGDPVSCRLLPIILCRRHCRHLFCAANYNCR